MKTFKILLNGKWFTIMAKDASEAVDKFKKRYNKSEFDYITEIKPAGL